MKQDIASSLSRRVTIVPLCIGLFIGVQNASAQDASTNMDVRVAVNSGASITCTALNFGAISFDAGTAEATETGIIEIDPRLDQAITTTGSGFTHDTSDVQRGECTVSAPSFDRVTVRAATDVIELKKPSGANPFPLPSVDLSVANGAQKQGDATFGEQSIDLSAVGATTVVRFGGLLDTGETLDQWATNDYTGVYTGSVDIEVLDTTP